MDLVDFVELLLLLVEAGIYGYSARVRHFWIFERIHFDVDKARAIVMEYCSRL
jgi:hypothetical protein